MVLEVSGALWYWRGPSPFHFVTVPEPAARRIRELAASVTYGWGMIPVTCRSGDSTWTTSLWPKDGSYVIPIKDAVRRELGLELDDVVTIALRIRV